MIAQADPTSRVWARLIPDRPARLWDWSTDNIVLPIGESSSVLSFDHQRAGIFKRIIRVISRRRLGLMDEGEDFRVEQAWCICSAQLGKTINVIFTSAGWHAKYWPHVPLGIVWPTIDVRKQQLKGRLEPMFQSSPALLDLLPEPGTEAYTHAITERLWKTNNGGRIRALVGNIANDCRANPLAVILSDEFDALKANVGNQGDPIQLLIDRQRTFPRDRLFVGTTTPTTVQGHGWRRLCSGTHERLLIECVCGGVDWVNPNNLRATDDTMAPRDVRRQDAARWHCRHCGVGHDTDALHRMIADAVTADRWCPGVWGITDDQPRGIWTMSAKQDEAGRIVGAIPQPDDVIRSWHLNLLYSTTGTLGEFLAAEMIALAGRDEDRQAHWNTARAEPWIATQQDAATDEERDAVISDDRLGIIPAWNKHLLLMIDQQGNTEAQCWFPWVLRSFGDDGKSQLVDCGKIEKSITHPGAGWGGLELLCDRSWPADDGRQIAIDLCVMDNANGNMGRQVRQWAYAQYRRRMLYWGAPRLPPDEHWRVYEPGKRSRLPMPSGVMALEIHPTHWREQLDARRRMAPGYAEWRMAEGAPAYYLRSIWESEERVIVSRQVTGQGVREVTVWKPTMQTDSLGRITYRKDNHWWDLEVGALAIADHLGWTRPPPPPPTPIHTPSGNDDYVGAGDSYL